MQLPMQALWPPTARPPLPGKGCQGTQRGLLFLTAPLDLKQLDGSSAGYSTLAAFHAWDPGGHKQGAAAQLTAPDMPGGSSHPQGVLCAAAHSHLLGMLLPFHTDGATHPTRGLKHFTWGLPPWNPGSEAREAQRNPLPTTCGSWHVIALFSRLKRAAYKWPGKISQPRFPH